MMPAVSSPERVCNIAGTFNFRDLGGYPTTDGRRTRWRTLYRSDALHRLDSAGLTAVGLLGLRTVVDLRYPTECTAAPCLVDAGATTVRSLPLFDKPAAPADGQAPDLERVYQTIVDQRWTQLAAVLHALAEPGALPAVINCTAGKDRTGVVVALLLGLLGVEREAIVADYALSGPLLVDSPLATVIRDRLAERGGEPAAAARLLASPPAYMERLLDYVDEEYGGAAALVERAGVAGAQVEVLRASLLE